MRSRRVLSIWFPHLGAERVLRSHRGRITQPFACVRKTQSLLSLSSLSPLAAKEGLHIGQSVTDARAICTSLITASENVPADQAFMSALQRWAGQFSPWVSIQGETGLCLDITGCAHLFGGEEPLVKSVIEQIEDLSLTAQIGLADTVGAAWALARFANQPLHSDRSGDAIEQEARATRARAYKRRHWERGGSRPAVQNLNDTVNRIAPPGGSAAAIACLPVAALRLSEASVTGMARLGLRRISDLLDMPRAALARRFGADVLTRLDQAINVTPEPVSPLKPTPHFATRLSFPDPIGLPEDITAGMSRLLRPLCEKLKAHAMGCRKLQLTVLRSDSTYQMIEIGLARTTNDADRIFPLMTTHLPNIAPGFGIDIMRLQASVVEPLSPVQHSGPLNALAAAKTRRDGDTSEEDLIGRLGARIGLETITQLHPVESMIPEKTESSRISAYSDPPEGWQIPTLPRPLLIFRPEPLRLFKDVDPLTSFGWRRRTFKVSHAQGPERIAPEWWLDDPNWRTGTRDYWKVTTKEGPSLWIFKTQPNTWSCQGLFG
ncbi:MAG: DNA polymerase Y family protein [Pseudomonadota bacterium]